MMKPIFSLTLVATVVLILNACSESNSNHAAMNSQIMKTEDKPVTRWYNRQQVEQGGVLYQQYCAECHQKDASGTANWRQLDANGKYPPPPLNGTAHTWHHHLDGLRRTVRIGGIPLGGSMPAFGDKLNAQEIDAVLAWLQSKWSDEIYAAWHEINNRAITGGKG